MSNNGRMTIEDTLGAILDVLQQISERPGGAGNSSIDIEDMANGKVKVTTKGYVGVELTDEYIRQRIAEHGLAHRLAEAAALNGWKETLEVLKAENANPSHRDGAGVEGSQWAPHAFTRITGSGVGVQCAVCALPETASVHHGSAVRPDGRDPNPFDRYQEPSRA